MTSLSHPRGNVTGVSLYDVDFYAKRLQILKEAVPLMAYEADLGEAGRRMADDVHEILTGTKPGGIPIYQSTKFDLVINLKTAKALGLTLPPILLGTADEVIE